MAMTSTTDGSKRFFQAAGTSILAVVLVSATTGILWLLRDELTIANVSLIYMLLTLITAVWLGTIPSLIVAVLSFFCFNYFLVRPYYTLAVEDTRELLDLIIFLLAAMMTSRLAGYARRQADTVRQNAADQEILLRLSTALNPLTDREAIMTQLRQVLTGDVGALRCEVLPSKPSSTPATPVSDRGIYVLLEAGDQIYGTVWAEFPRPLMPSEHRLLLACVAQTAVAMQRVELMDQAQHSRSLAEADQLKTALLHAVSHDLRTPITIIKTSATHLDELSDHLSTEQQRELAQTIETQADRLNTLVSNLLDMSRLQAGAMILNTDWYSLEEIAGEVAARAYQLSNIARIALEFPDDFPLVRCDYGLILQALQNIVENALRYEPAGRLVVIRGTADPDHVRIEVINHGPDLPDSEKLRVTEPFFQGDPSRAIVGSVGLGLAIARGIVEVHRGRIAISDTPGGGVTFVIYLPRQEMEP